MPGMQYGATPLTFVVVIPAPAKVLGGFAAKVLGLTVAAVVACPDVSANAGLENKTDIVSIENAERRNSFFLFLRSNKNLNS